ncbi:FecR family protein [Chitinophaga sp. RAB17]|uniref:FecR family protein n=1 Tax=Chitinophaga sp. RAB17 TaxID=3233049 RepID=UPI003F8F87E6
MHENKKEYFQLILKKYRTGNASEEEIKFLETFFDLFESNEDLITADNEADYLPLKAAMKHHIDQQIDQHSASPASFRIYWMVGKVAAAAILVFLVAYYFMPPHRLTNKAADYAVNNALPATGKPTLTLSDGSVIYLNDSTKGEIARQSGVIITRTKDGAIVYNAGSQPNATGQVPENTFSTPKGVKYKIMLPDGSSAWLNALSSLSYPTRFTAAERVVTLNGEGYFEIKPNAQQPFVVKSGTQRVQVLGTHFNVNAYADESAIKTTLLEGSVKVSTSNGSYLIVPGEQVIASRDNNKPLRKITANTEKETAWVNDIFSFKNDDLPYVMRQIGRWYDIDIKYEGSITPEKFSGEISRSSGLSDVLTILMINDIKFSLTGNVLTISNGSNK